MSRHRPLASLACLRGNFHEGNFGDDALLLASSSLLRGRIKQIKFERKVAYCDERVQRTFTGDHSMEPDMIVYGGGTQFFSFAAPVVQHSFISRLARKLSSPTSLMASYRARTRAAQNRRIPKIAIGIGLGPFENPVAAEQTADLLRKMDLVWVRDAYSESFCRDNNIRNFVASSDLCFTEAFAQIIAPPLCRRPAVDRPRKISIILRDWPTLDAHFFERQVALARKLRNAGHEVRFLGLSKHDKSYLTEMATQGETVRVWDADSERLEDFWTVIAEQDLVVTSRFHGAIFALLSATPFIAIEIEPKLRTLRDMVPELGDFAIAPRTTVNTMHQAIETLVGRGESVLPALDRALSKQRTRARAGEEALGAYFSGKLQK
jgi:polysaccharide pyruvyl transferase WcaK-like protein